MAGDFFSKRWNSFKEFDDDFRQYCEQTKEAFSISDSRSVEKKNAKLGQGEVPYRQELKYSYVRYGCIHHVSRSTRHVPSSFKTQCPVTFLLSAKQDGSDQFLTVTAQVMHHNHETDAESYKLHQSVRRLDANKHQTQEDLFTASAGMECEAATSTCCVEDQQMTSMITACDQSSSSGSQFKLERDESESVDNGSVSETEQKADFEAGRNVKIAIESSHGSEDDIGSVNEPVFDTETYNVDDGETETLRNVKLESVNSEDIAVCAKKSRLDTDSLASTNEDTSDRSDRRRNKSTPAVVLLGLVKSRLRKHVTERRRESAAESTSSHVGGGGSAVCVKSESAASLLPVSSSSSTSSLRTSSPAPEARTSKSSHTSAASDWIKPFDLGWRREVVHRGTSSTSLSSKPMADVYYFSPSNVKLRSRPEVIDYLKRTKSPLSPDCFTFAREPIYHEPAEVVRMAGVAKSAGRRQSKTRNVTDTQAGASASRSASDCKERRSASQLPAKMNTTSLLKQSSVKSSPVSDETVMVSTRGRPRKRPATVVSMTTERQQPVKRVLLLPTISGQNTAKQCTDSGSAGQPSLLLRKSMPALLEKLTTSGQNTTTQRTDRQPSVLLRNSPSVLLEKPASCTAVTARSSTSALSPLTSSAGRVSKMVVINTSFDKSRPAKIVGSSAPMKSLVSPAVTEISLLATSAIGSSSSSSKPPTAATLLIIRSSSPSLSSSSNTDSMCTAAAATVVKNSSGNVVMSVKKVSRTAPVKYTVVKDAAATSKYTVVKDAGALSSSSLPKVLMPLQPPFVPAQPGLHPVLSPVVKYPPYRPSSNEASTGSLVSAKTSTAMQDRWKPLKTTNEASHTKTNVGLWTSKVCGMDCSGRLGVPPALYCDMCMSLFHPECVGLSYLGRHVGFLCAPCRQLTVELQTSRYHIRTQLPHTPPPAVTSSDETSHCELPHTLLTNGSPSETSSHAVHPASTESLAGWSVVSAGLVTASTSTLTVTSTDISPAVTVSTVSSQCVTSVSTVSAAVPVSSQVVQSLHSSQSSTGSDLVEPTTQSASETAVHAVSAQSSRDDSSLLQTASLQQVDHAELTVSNENVSGTAASQDCLDVQSVEAEVTAKPLADVSQSDVTTSAAAESTAADSAGSSGGGVICHRGDEDNVNDGSGHAEMATELNENVARDADMDNGSQEKTGVSPPAENVSRDDDGEQRTAKCEESPPREPQSRQVLTLPAGLLAHINTSLPISLSLRDNADEITVVPASNVYQSTCGLSLLLPAHCLPAEYVDSKQLACTFVRRSGQSQLISISLTLHS